MWGAVALRARRDDGAGHPRPAPRAARPPRRALTHPLGLAVRLQRGVLIGWSAGLFLSGVSIGLTGSDAKSLLGDSDEIDEASSARARATSSTSTSRCRCSTMALIGAGFGIQVALRMRAEETSGRLEPLLATALSRGRWGGAYVAVAMARLAARARRQRRSAPALADAINSHDAGQLPRLLPPASCRRRRCGSWSARRSRCSASCRAPPSRGWGVLGACVLLSVLGPLLGLPDWVLDLSPFQHVPQLPAAEFAAGPLLALCAVAAALTAAGMAAFRRRDLAP